MPVISPVAQSLSPFIVVCKVFKIWTLGFCWSWAIEEKQRFLPSLTNSIYAMEHGWLEKSDPTFCEVCPLFRNSESFFSILIRNTELIILIRNNELLNKEKMCLSDTTGITYKEKRNKTPPKQEYLTCLNDKIKWQMCPLKEQYLEWRDPKDGSNDLWKREVVRIRIPTKQHTQTKPS